jgi:hypothetical protein
MPAFPYRQQRALDEDVELRPLHFDGVGAKTGQQNRGAAHGGGLQEVFSGDAFLHVGLL